jgi:NADH-ubiquinone oxidoreductase chain 4
MLLTLVLVPLIGALLISFLKEEIKIKQTALIATVITFLLSLYLFIVFDSNSSEIQLTSSIAIAKEIQIKLGIDGLSLYFILLTRFTLPICIIADHQNTILTNGSGIDQSRSIKPLIGKENNTDSFYEKPIVKESRKKQYLIYFLVLESLLFLVFIVQDILSFYIRFESVLIPLFLIVGVYGASSARVRARFLLFLYTLFGSLFILLAFVSLYYLVGSPDFIILQRSNLSFDTQKILFLGIFLSFAIKTPLVPFHV